MDIITYIKNLVQFFKKICVLWLFVYVCVSCYFEMSVNKMIDFYVNDNCV